MGLGVLLAFTVKAAAQANPRGAADMALKGKAISIEYGRPSLRGRAVDQLLGQLKPGDVWRLGADQSTTLSTAIDLAFGDVTVPRGEYSLWALREADGSWTLVFNNQHGQWGTRRDPAQDLAAVPLKQSRSAKPLEILTVKLAREGVGEVVTIQ